MQTEFFDSMDRLLSDVYSVQVIREIEAGRDGAPALWQALIDSGFLDLLVPEEAGGAGLYWQQAWPVLFAAGRHGLVLPLGQTMWARAVLAQMAAQIPADSALAISGFGVQDAAGIVRAQQVPSARMADVVLVQVAESVYAVPLSECTIEPVGGAGCFDANLAFKPAAALGTLPTGTVAQGLAGVLAIQMAGAADRVLQMTLSYANERQQFGKPIGRFQALQQQISEMAEHVYAMRMASQMAVQQEGWLLPEMQACLAKSQTSASAALVARIAHAVHGAMGVTQAFDLQILTRKLYEWARLGGGEHYWAMRMGQAALQQDKTLLDFMRQDLFAVASSADPQVA